MTMRDMMKCEGATHHNRCETNRAEEEEEDDVMNAQYSLELESMMKDPHLRNSRKTVK